MGQTERFVGIDVSKSTLDVAVWPADAPWTEAHTESGITALVARLQELQPTLIVLEATGGLWDSLGSGMSIDLRAGATSPDWRAFNRRHYGSLGFPPPRE